MAWTHDTGYPPAYRHVGYPASVLADGTDTRSTSARIEPDVIGWRAACECGWRGVQFYLRAEWPSRTGGPSVEVDGWETGGGTYADWSGHLDRVLPELAVHDLARQFDDVRMRLDVAARSARRAGLPWSVIGSAAGITAERAEQRWGADTSGTATGRRPGTADRSNTPPSARPPTRESR